MAIEISSRRDGGEPLRASAGAAAVLLGALLLAGMVALLAGDVAAGAERSAAQLRLQFAVQAAVLAAGALGLAALLSLSRPPAPGDALRWPAPPAAPAGVLALAAACTLGLLIAGPLVSALLPGLSDPEATVDRLAPGRSAGGDVLTVLLIAGCVPLAEELLFRGVVAGAWLRAQRPLAAVLVSGVLFGLAHVTVGERSIAVATLIGLLLAATLLVAGTLAAPVLAHALLNAVALLGAGIDGPAPLLALAVAVVGAPAAAAGLHRWVAWVPPADRLPGVTQPASTTHADG